MSNCSLSSVLNTVRRPGLVRELVRGGGGNIAVRVAQIPLSVALSAVLARAMGPAGYGIYAYVFSLISVLVILGQFGLGKFITRETARGHALGKLSLIAGVWRWSFMLGICTTAIIAFVALAIVMSLRYSLPGGEFSTCLFGIALLPLLVFSGFFADALLGLRNVVLSQFLNALLRPGIFFLLILMVIWRDGAQMTASHAMVLHVTAAGATLLIGGLLLFYRRPRGLFQSEERVYQPRAWLMATMPFILISAFTQISQYADIVMIGLFGTKEEVGVYRVAVQAGLLGLMGLQAAQFLVQPYIARFYGQNDFGRLKRLIAVSSRGAFALSLLVFLVLAIAGRQLIVLIFGGEYVGCYFSMLILAAGQVVNASFGVANILLEMTGHQKDSARAFLVGAACNIVLNLVLIPLFDLVGAATATATAVVVVRVLLWRAAHYRLGVETFAIAFRNAS